MRDTYLGSVKIIERLHRQFLEVIKVEIDHIKADDINNIQALILFNIGKEEMTIGELTNRGHYLGSNVSYNVNKMVLNGYLEQKRSANDKRSVRIKLSKKGLELFERLDDMIDRHIYDLAKLGLKDASLIEAFATLQKLEDFWIDITKFGVRDKRAAS